MKIRGGGGGVKMIVYHMEILSGGKINENKCFLRKNYSSSNFDLWDRKRCEIPAVPKMRTVLYFWFQLFSVVLHRSTNSLN